MSLIQGFVPNQDKKRLDNKSEELSIETDSEWNEKKKIVCDKIYEW